MLESESQDVIINLFCWKYAKCFEFSSRRAVLCMHGVMANERTV